MHPEGLRFKFFRWWIQDRAVVEVGFHSLRHTIVSLCKANNVPRAAIQERVGHSSPAMTALYTHAGEELRTKAVAALPAMSFLSRTCYR